MNVTFELNGEQMSLPVQPDRSLRSVLREKCGEKSVKTGCDSGRCGSCTVLLDGNAVKSCLVLAPKVDGRSIVTVEGLDASGRGGDVQTAFETHAALQCGYCTPGFVLTVLDFLEDADSPDREAIRAAIRGNVCRCTGYEKILDATADLSGQPGSDAE